MSGRACGTYEAAPAPCLCFSFLRGTFQIQRKGGGRAQPALPRVCLDYRRAGFCGSKPVGKVSDQRALAGIRCTDNHDKPFCIIDIQPLPLRRYGNSAVPLAVSCFNDHFTPSYPGPPLPGSNEYFQKNRLRRAKSPVSFNEQVRVEQSKQKEHSHG